MKKAIVLIGFVCVTISVFGQDKLAYADLKEATEEILTVHGTLSELVGEEKIGLAFANVTVEGTVDFTFTEMDGSFTLNTCKKDGMLKFTFKGYESVVLPIGDDMRVDVVLRKKPNKKNTPIVADSEI